MTVVRPAKFDEVRRTRKRRVARESQRRRRAAEGELGGQFYYSDFMFRIGRETFTWRRRDGSIGLRGFEANDNQRTGRPRAL